MFYCNNCGQCSYINDENFTEFLDTRGWESRYIDCVNGSTIDWGESETNDSEHSCYQCPNCDCEDIDDQWDGTAEEARELRNSYESALRVLAQQRLAEQAEREKRKKRTDPNRDWDGEDNV